MSSLTSHQRGSAPAGRPREGTKTSIYLQHLVGKVQAATTIDVIACCGQRLHR